MVEKCSCISDLSEKLSRFGWRWNWWYSRNYQQIGLFEKTWNRCNLALTGVSFATGWQWIRYFRLSGYWADVRNNGRYGTVICGGKETRNPNYDGSCAESYFRWTQMVYGGKEKQRQSVSWLLCVAWRRRRYLPKWYEFCVRRTGMGVGSRTGTVLFSSVFSETARSELGESESEKRALWYDSLVDGKRSRRISSGCNRSDCKRARS